MALNESDYFYGARAVMLAERAIMFCCCRLDLLSFSALDLRGRSIDFHRTLQHVRLWPGFIKFSQKCIALYQKTLTAPPPLPPPPKKHQNYSAISDNLATVSTYQLAAIKLDIAVHSSCYGRPAAVLAEPAILFCYRYSICSTLDFFTVMDNLCMKYCYLLFCQ